MIHPRRGGGASTQLRLVLLLGAVAVAIVVAAVASGAVELGFQVPWKGVATLAIVGLVALASRLRRA